MPNRPIHTNWLTPALRGDAVFKLIETQISSRQQFRQHDDLTGMHREVFGDVEDGFEEVDVVALDFATLQQGRGIEGVEDRFYFSES